MTKEDMDMIWIAIKQTASIHEGSWNKGESKYRITIFEAAQRVCEGMPGMDQIVGLLLYKAWNDALMLADAHWAQK